MCSILGCVTSAHNLQLTIANAKASAIRGRDGFGVSYTVKGGDETIRSIKTLEPINDFEPHKLLDIPGQLPLVMVGNYRAEPTTEFVRRKTVDDQQPYICKDWVVVHNGTVANDKEHRTYAVNTEIDSAVIAEMLGVSDKLGIYDKFLDVLLRLKGSYAILAYHRSAPDLLMAACNYRPIWYLRTTNGYYFSSVKDGLESYGGTAVMMKPYSAAMYSPEGVVIRSPLLPPRNNRALVVCSGGLDSTVAAAKVKNDGYEVELLHFQYGCRAEGKEEQSVRDVAAALSVPLHFMPMGVIYDPADSPLLREDSGIAGGEAGAEFAFEWVPARNTVMLAIATAFAEAKGFDNIVLGNNMEEAGAYPDNEPQFIDNFNALLPFAVGNGRQVQILMPVGNLMKHEIVALGNEVDAPMNLTWSCYRQGDLHCGKCGPCFMRRTAFEINYLIDTVQYTSN